MFNKLSGYVLFLFGFSVCFAAFGANTAKAADAGKAAPVATAPAVAAPAKAGAVNKQELDKAKKEGDDNAVTKAKEKNDEFGAEAAKALSNDATSGKSTYGVVGFDYLTGVGKIGSDVAGTNLGEKSPLKNLIDQRLTGTQKWTGKADATHSGWSEKTGVTEVWNRGQAKAQNKIGADYNEWVNQWNIPTRPATNGITPIAGADPDQGAHWFSFYCVHCHGWTGKGDGPTATELDPRPRNQTNGKYLNSISNLDLFGAIKGGGAFRNLSEAMPPWGNVLQDQDIWNVVAFLRTLATPAYQTHAGEVTAASAAKSAEFKEMNEQLELDDFMAGRGGGQTGGFDSIGGGRLASKKVGVGDVKSSAVTIGQGDWFEDKK